MTTNDENARRRRIDDAITQRVLELHPELVDPDKCRINLMVSWPRPYMGRFDSGKVYWTIDLKERETYSKTQQVRVRVEQDGTFAFDEAKLAEKIEYLRRIVQAKQTQDATQAAAAKQIPRDKPYGVVVCALPTGLFNLEFKRFSINADFMQRLVKALGELPKE